MNYWDAKAAIADLIRFRDVYVDWANARHGRDHDRLTQLHCELARLVPVAQDRLHALGPDAGSGN